METVRVDVFIIESPTTPEDIGLCVVVEINEEEDKGTLRLWFADEGIGLLDDEGPGTIGAVVSIWDTPADDDDDDDAIG
jgi:hypothetical protein